MPKPRSSRLVVLALVACLLAVAAHADAPDDTLRILLMNDDGVEAPGIRVLRAALRKEGHRVLVVAPAGNRSGSSVAITTSGSLEVERVEPGVWSVNGTPADCARLAITTLLEEPVDLAIAGINFGQNVGIGTISSGTVGSALTATSLGVPAIAVSQTVDPDDVRNTVRYYPDAAAFTVALVALLAKNADGGPLVPPGITLNVNYPARHQSELAGVRLTRQGRSSLYTVVYERGEDGQIMMGFAPSTKKESVKGADTTALTQGYVSITPLDASWTAGDSQLDALRPLADALSRSLPARKAASAE